VINSVVIVGRVGQEPSMKYFESGKVKTTFSIAVNRWAKGEEKTDWFNIELWDKNAEIAGEYVKKGKQVAIEGSLKINKWTSNDGIPKESFIVNASGLRLLGGKKNES
jgi:single-strand DNA-binding protein